MRLELERAVKLLFQRVSIERLLTLQEENKIYYNQVKPDYLQDLMLTYSQEFSDTERNLQLSEIVKQMEQNQKLLVPSAVKGTLHVFSALLFCIPNILTFHENQVACKYNMLLEWNDLTLALGEDLPVLVMLVKRDLEQGKICTDFSWPPVIGHNNSQLSKILMRGMADNHFHLRGSAPYFYIAWLNLMNNPGRKNFLKPFERIEQNYRDKNKKSEVMIQRQPLSVLVAEASLIRFYLCMKLKGQQFHLFKCLVSSKDLSQKILYRIEREQKRKEAGKVDMKDGKKSESFTCKVIELEQLKPYLTNDEYEHLKENIVQNQIRMLLANSRYIEVNMELIQTAIDSMAGNSGDIDYMQQFAPTQNFCGREEYKLLAGERWFIYHMLKAILIEDHTFTIDEYNWFYAYLRIKSEICSELTQTNHIVGFENFQIYQKRKDWFTHLEDFWKSEKKLARLAVWDILNSPSMHFLEVRISPANTAYENMLQIRNYDEAITNSFDKDEELVLRIRSFLNQEQLEFQSESQEKADLKKRFFYVLHFTKRGDNPIANVETLECRHFQYRRLIKQKANEILHFRSTYPQYGRRVAGIDACSQEIGCRPEVFGRVFRTLKNYCYPLYNEKIGNAALPQLKLTYHVGEDYLDVVDGLRAIDEAIRFLGLDCGDRMGHAIALGVNAKDWYGFKNKQIIMPLQDYLDNIVWLYHALNKYQIDGFDSLRGWLQEQYSHYFFYIYQHYLSGVNQEGIAFIQSGTLNKFDINIYYLSWLLRGDQPSLYKTGKFQEELRSKDQWGLYAVNKKYIRSDDIRHIPEVALLYHMYHYSREARIKGSEMKTFHIPDHYISSIGEIQKAMMDDIVNKGISIETNPSSNIRIGTYLRFGNHPIKTFYNSGLTKDLGELMACPQINVSINTDDRGVFSTKLENEYALLACAMEQEKTAEGCHRYKKEFIYEWLDNIREMGIRQVFLS